MFDQRPDRLQDDYKHMHTPNEGVVVSRTSTVWFVTLKNMEALVKTANAHLVT